jgi:hypothetical protein
VGSSNLFDDDVDLIAVLHVEVLGGLGLMETFSVEEEPDVASVELCKQTVTLWRWQ